MIQLVDDYDYSTFSYILHTGIYKDLEFDTVLQRCSIDDNYEQDIKNVLNPSEHQYFDIEFINYPLNKYSIHKLNIIRNIGSNTVVPLEITNPANNNGYTATVNIDLILAVCQQKKHKCNIITIVGTGLIFAGSYMIWRLFTKRN